MDLEEAYDLTETFESEDLAIERAREIVAESCDELGFEYGQYTMFGEDPAVIAPDGRPPCGFSAWDYAREICEGRRPPTDQQGG